MMDDANHFHIEDVTTSPEMEPFLCPVDEAARIIGQKWTLQIVHELLEHPSRRFCELQEALGGVNPSTLSSRLKMLEEEGLVRRVQVSAVPLHVEYSLTSAGAALRDVIAAVTKWSNAWLCGERSAYSCVDEAPVRLSGALWAQLRDA